MKRNSNANEITGKADGVLATAITPESTEHDAALEMRRRIVASARGLRLPAASDADALRSVLVPVAVVAVSLFLGYLTGAGVASPLLTTTLFCLVVFAGLSLGGRRAAKLPAQAAEDEDSSGSRWRILLVAGRTPTVEQLQVLRIAAPRAMLDVHAPVLPDQCASTERGHEIELARNRLRATLARAERAGIAADGEVGDPDDPIAGIADQLGRQHIDEVLVATRPLSGGDEVESALLRQLRSQLDKPITHVEIQ